MSGTGVEEITDLQDADTRDVLVYPATVSASAPKLLNGSGSSHDKNSGVVERVKIGANLRWRLEFYLECFY